MDMGEIMNNKITKKDNDFVVSTIEETLEQPVEDFYRYHEKIEIPICFYKDDNGEKVYDYEAMAEEFENKLSKITGATVMCSVSEDIIYED